jgi:hypothetical protein
MRTPEMAWQYYERERQAGNVCALTPPSAQPSLDALVEPVLSPAKTAQEATNPFVNTSVFSSVSLIKPFPDGRDIFVVYRGRVPGIHYGW